MSGLPADVRRSIWIRQFLVQGCWNYEGMQNVGFAYCMLPALRRFYKDRPEELAKAVKRHLEFFNTQPAMGGVILGATVRLEEKVAAGEEDARAIGAFKVGLMGSLGAIGDAYFWGALKPMAAAAGVLLALIHPLLGIGAMLLLYNASHLSIRLKGFVAGMEGQESAVRFLKGSGFKLRTEDRKLMATVLAGAYAGVVVAERSAPLWTGQSSPWTGAVLGAGILLGAAGLVHLFAAMYRKAVSPSDLMLLLLIVGLIILGQ